MFVVVFAVQPKPSEWETYLDLAASLRPKLEQMPGFVDNERYRSEAREGRVLSLSTWEDEKALVRWRVHAHHHEVQEKGRFQVFEDYRLRIGEVVADTATEDLPTTRLDVTRQGRGEALTITQVEPGADPPDEPAGTDGLLTTEWYDGLKAAEGERLLLATWATARAAETWTPEAGRCRHRRVRVVRDYGMHERDEAPQYYPPVGPQGPSR
jgi:heme-degrading monooxygenase HmoA